MSELSRQVIELSGHLERKPWRDCRMGYIIGIIIIILIVLYFRSQSRIVECLNCKNKMTYRRFKQKC